MSDLLRLLKGHGTENDFLVLLDPDGVQADVTSRPGLVAVLCDRRAGIGADGMIRAVRADDAGTGATWFMDYRNSDGGVAEMCGNGIRVLAEVLDQAGLADPAGFIVATRSGGRRLHRVPQGWSVTMGDVVVGVPDGGGGDAVPGDGAVDTLVAARGLGQEPRPGMRVSVGNPHVVVAVTGSDELAAVDLTVAPALHPAPTAGANVEFVEIRGLARSATGDLPHGHVAMRVHERGSGETRSCGTGAVAAAAAAAAWAGPGSPATWTVDVPGGRLVVDLRPDGTACLAGPAVLVGGVEIDRGWLSRFA